MLITSLLLLLFSNAVTLRRDKAILYSRTTIVMLIIIIVITIDNLNMTALSTGIGLFGGLFHATSISQVFQSFIYTISAVILVLTAFYPRNMLRGLSITYLLNKNYHEEINTSILNIKAEQYKIIEYPLILLFIITGATFLISSSDIVSIFLSIELQSYGLYLLATLYRNSELSTSAGLTYFLLGGLSSCFILLGTSLLYANSGTTSLEGFYIINNIWEINKNNFLLTFDNDYVNYALIIMSVGFLFKISAAPFHFWSPDVYDAIPTIVTTFVAIIAKISVLIFLLEIVHYTTCSSFAQGLDWRYSLLLSSLLSLIIGTVLGLNQFRIKRLYAYSTISHIGFILLALSINSVESIQAFIFYLMQYSLANLNAFALLIVIGFSLYRHKSEEKKEKFQDKDNSPIQLISQMKGYFYFNPLIALSLAITIYSFVGVPPLLGFFAKQMVLSAALDNGFIFLTLVAILTSVISAVYYLSVIKQIFFDEFEYKTSSEFHETPLNPSEIKLSCSLTIVISMLTLVILLFFLNPQQFTSISNILCLLLFNP